MIYRSLLFAPGDNARLAHKCVAAGADIAVLDLEDAVAESRKAVARESVAAVLALPRSCLGYVRINALSTDWCYADLVATVRPGVDGILVPKMETAGQMTTVQWLVSALERERSLPPGSIDIIPILESAAGFADLRSIARAATRVRRIAFGAGDLSLDIGFTWTEQEAELQPYRALLATESRAAGLDAPIDTGYPNVHDVAAFEYTTRLARAQGFLGKLCIHPQQVQVANDVFRPSDADVAQARKVSDAFALAEAEGRASILVEGRFVDYPIASQARCILERAQQIHAREQSNKLHRSEPPRS